MEEEHNSNMKQSEEALTIKKETLWKSATIILAVLLIISVYTGGFGYGTITGNTIVEPSGNNPSPSEVKQPTPTPTPTPTLDMEKLADDDAIEGDPDAPVTIIEFSDYECPFCVRFYEQTLSLIRTQYVDTGKVKIIFRDYPLGFHPNAQKAAEAAECAGEQGKYYEMHDKLFENGVTGGVTSFKTFASEIGLNKADFDECLDSDSMADEVQKDLKDGQAAGIRGTPGFIINGKLISGAQPFEVFKQAIEAEL